MNDDKFSVILEKVGNQPLMTTKVLLQELGLGLAAAKAMADKAPTTVATGMERGKALALARKLEAIGNTVSIPGMEIRSAATAKTDKAAEPKKETPKKSPTASLNVTTPSNCEFDAIFGESITPKATATAKNKDSVKTTPKTKADKISAAPNDEFDAIFGKGK